MSKISDELREHGNGYFEQRNGDCEWLYDIADRIDNEMVELPKDADGREVPLDTKELYDANGKRVPIASFTFKCGIYGRWSYWKAFSPAAKGKDGMFFVDGLYLTPPDSWERIADEMDKFVDDTPGIDTFYASTASRLRDFADRIRKLAKEQTNE